MENIDIMNDNELDLFARKAFITSMESSSDYVSPVSLMYGVGLETAYDDGFFSRLMRGLGRATAFTNASKVKAALKDIRHLSVDKISDGETSGVSVDRKTLAMASNFAKTFHNNISKSKDLIDDFFRDFNALKNDTVLRSAIEHEIKNAKTGNRLTIAIMSILKIISTQLIATGLLAVTSISVLSFPTGLAALGLLGLLALIPIAVRVIDVVIIIKALWDIATYEEVSKEYKEAIKSRLSGLNSKADKVFKAVSGVSIDSNGEAFVSKYSEIIGFEPAKDRTVSKEEKVQIVQGLIALSDEEGKVIKSLGLTELKSAIKTFSKLSQYVKDMPDNVQLKRNVQTVAKVQATMYKLVDSSLKIILATLNDAKKY